MAKKPAAKPKASKAKAGSGRAKVFGYILAPLIAIVAYPTIIVALGGMMPTMVAYIVDNRPERFAAKTVGYLNGAGVFFVASDMWTGNHSWQRALELLADPLNWLIMLGAASLGWALFYIVPPAVNAYLTVSNDMKLKQLAKDQGNLKKDWGDGVAREAPDIEEILGAEEEETADKETPATAA